MILFWAHTLLWHFRSPKGERDGVDSRVAPEVIHYHAFGGDETWSKWQSIYARRFRLGSSRINVPTRILHWCELWPSPISINKCGRQNRREVSIFFPVIFLFLPQPLPTHFGSTFAHPPHGAKYQSIWRFVFIYLFFSVRLCVFGEKPFFPHSQPNTK